MAEFKTQHSGVVYTGQGALEHVELMSLTGAVDVQLIDSSSAAGQAFLDLSTLSGESRESNRVRLIRTGVYCAMTGSGILNINIR
jgi:hypothetical protein